MGFQEKYYFGGMMKLWIFIVWSSFWGHFFCFIRVKVQAEYEDFICIFFLSFLSGGGGG